MRLIPLAAIVLAVLPAVEAAPVPKHLIPKEEPFWPTEVGTKWVYELLGREFSEEITKAEVRDNTTRLTVMSNLNFAGPSEHVFDVTPGYVIHRSIDGRVLDYVSFQPTAKPGDSWAVPIPGKKVDWSHRGTRAIAETENLKVPAGTFRATKVVYTMTERHGQRLEVPETEAMWYAKSVGLVKWGDNSQLILKSFTPGKK